LLYLKPSDLIVGGLGLWRALLQLLLGDQLVAVFFVVVVENLHLRSIGQFVRRAANAR
jgi:hypothetical protein